MKKQLVALCIAIGLGGCAVQAIDPGRPATVGEITVDPQLKWANINTPATSGTVWTIDGLGLDELRFYSGIKPGEPLVSSRDPSVPKYDSSMLPDDLAEFFTGTLGAAGFRQVHTSDLKPIKVGNFDGVTFHLTFTTDDGLQMEGLALAAQRNTKLDAMLFIAPHEYYFDQYRTSIERIFSSARLSE